MDLDWKKSIENFKRGLLMEYLSVCSEPQKELFGRIFPGGIGGVPEKDLESAIDLCARTVKKNQENPDRLNNA
jgi:hypothetical protein